MIFVFVWLREGENVGHGSMQFDTHYVSNWPLEAKSAIYGRGSAAARFDDDVDSEGRWPHYAFRLNGLDEAAMGAKWEELKADLTYSYILKNCFATVATVLSEGLSGKQALVANTMQPPFLVKLHAQLLAYVHAVSIATGNGVPKNLISGKNVFREAFDVLRQRTG
jgi:hypothetical protein